MQRSIELLRSSMTSLNKLWNSLSSLLQDRNVGYISSYLHSTAWCNDKLALRVHGNVCWTVQYLQSKRWAGTVHFEQARSQVLRVRKNIQFHGAIFLFFLCSKQQNLGYHKKFVSTYREFPLWLRTWQQRLMAMWLRSFYCTCKLADSSRQPRKDKFGMLIEICNQQLMAWLIC